MLELASTKLASKGKLVRVNLEVAIQLALRDESFTTNPALFSQNPREVSSLVASELLAAFEL